LQRLVRYKKDKPNSFVIKGTVKNFTDPSWNLLLTSFYSNEGIDMPVASDGSFSKTISITDPTDLYLYLNDDAIIVFASPGDTLNMNWDNKDFKNTFKIKTGQKEMDLMMDLYVKYWPAIRDIEKNIQEKSTPDSVIFNRVKGTFTGQVKTILKYPATVNSDKILYDTYSRDRYLLNILSRLSHKTYELSLDEAIPDSLREHYGLHLYSRIDKTLSEPLFLKSYEYREYITDKVRGDNPFSIFDRKDQHTQLNPNYTIEECYKAMAYLDGSPMIRDWYIAKTIMQDFYYYPFDQVEQAYRKFLPEMKTPIYKEALTSYYAVMQTLKPGAPAPLFSLKDSNGKMVSLKDFRGKVVYVDFWGVGCAPCIADIENYSAKFHEKYKDKNVVFLNVCVEQNETEWKKKMTQLHMEGINLIVPFISDPACKAYHIDGVPHYLIIDAKGNIVNNNAPGMADLLGQGFVIKRDKNGNNELDMALSME
jgi:peroxiredoxin